MTSPFPSPNETVVEYGAEMDRYLLEKVSHLSARDVQTFLFLQKYHEALYLYGYEIPKFGYSMSGMIGK